MCYRNIEMEVVMALFVNEKGQNGRLVPIENSNKKITENESYYALWVEDKHGKNEECLIFSDGDLKMFNVVKYSDFDEQMEFGALYRLGNSKSYFVRIIGLDRKPKVAKLTQTLIKNGRARASRNPEDIPRKGLIQNMFD